MLFLAPQRLVAQGGNGPISCPATEWKQETLPFECKFTNGSSADIPNVTVKQDASLVAVLGWDEQSIMEGETKKTHRLRNPSLVYGRQVVSVEWSGISMNLAVSFEGHFSSDFMRIDTVKVAEAQFNDAQNLGGAPKGTTTVNATTVNWAWAELEPILTMISKEGDEIELDHSSTQVQVDKVTQADGSEGVVLDENGNRIYPGNFNKPLTMKHKVTANCP